MEFTVRVVAACGCHRDNRLVLPGCSEVKLNAVHCWPFCGHQVRAPGKLVFFPSHYDQSLDAFIFTERAPELVH